MKLPGGGGGGGGVQCVERTPMDALLRGRRSAGVESRMCKPLMQHPSQQRCVDTSPARRCSVDSGSSPQSPRARFLAKQLSTSSTDDQKRERARMGSRASLSGVVQVARHMSRSHRGLLALPLLVLLGSIVCGVWSTLDEAGKEAQARRATALARATDKANCLASQVHVAEMMPVALGEFIRERPEWPHLNATFDRVAPRLMSHRQSLAITDVKLAPSGVLTRVEPLTGFESAIGADLLALPEYRAEARKAVRSRAMTLTGPVMLPQRIFGCVIRLPVFIPEVDADERFGNPSEPTDCPECYDSVTRSKFWGFTVVALSWDLLARNASGLYSLCEENGSSAGSGSGGGICHTDDGGARSGGSSTGSSSSVGTCRAGGRSGGYSFSMSFRDADEDSREVVFAGCGAMLPDPVWVDVVVPNNMWRLYVSDNRGWWPSDVASSLAMVVARSLVLCFLAAVLLTVIVLDADKRHATEEAERSRLQACLHTMQHDLSDLAEQRRQLQETNNALKAELETALVAYSPKTVINTGTPAQRMLTVIADLAAGQRPLHEDLQYIKGCLLEGSDVYQVVDFQQEMQSTLLKADESMALVNLLSTPGRTRVRRPVTRTMSHPLIPHAAAGAVGAGSSCTIRNGNGSSDLLSQMLNRSFHLECESRGTSCTPWGQVLPMGRSRTTELGNLHHDTMESIPSDGDEEMDCCIDDEDDDVGGVVSQLLRLGTGLREGLMGSSGSSGRRSPRTVAGAVAAAERSAGSATSTGAAGIGSPGGALLAGASPLAPLVAVMPRLVPSDKLHEVLATADDWSFDVFALAQVSNGRPLSALSFCLLTRTGLVQQFKLPTTTLARCLSAFEDGYKQLPFHNSMHAADVLARLHLLITRGGLMPYYADPLSHLACYLAALVHDLEHVGRTNDFLINTSDPLAMRYNDKAPMENHHCAAAFAMLRGDDTNFLKHLPRGEAASLRRMIIELVLATDMKQHFAVVSQFSSVHGVVALNAKNKRPLATSSSTNPTTNNSRRTSSELDLAEARASRTGSGVLQRQPLDENERILSLQVALKCADLGNLASVLPVHSQWVLRLEEEMFLQGDAELAEGLSVSPLCDRRKPGVSKSQISFFDVVAIPLFHAFVCVFPAAAPMMHMALSNLRHWTEVDAEARLQVPSSSGTTATTTAATTTAATTADATATATATTAAE